MQETITREQLEPAAQTIKWLIETCSSFGTNEEAALLTMRTLAQRMAVDPTTVAKQLLAMDHKIGLVWTVEDVRHSAIWMGRYLTDEQAWEVLQDIEHNHNANIGVDWVVIQTHIDAYVDGVVEDLAERHDYGVDLTFSEAQQILHTTMKARDTVWTLKGTDEDRLKQIPVFAREIAEYEQTPDEEFELNYHQVYGMWELLSCLSWHIEEAREIDAQHEDGPSEEFPSNDTGAALKLLESKLFSSEEASGE